MLAKEQLSLSHAHTHSLSLSHTLTISLTHSLSHTHTRSLPPSLSPPFLPRQEGGRLETVLAKEQRARREEQAARLEVERELTKVRSELKREMEHQRLMVLHINVQRFRGGLVFKNGAPAPHGANNLLLYYSQA